MPKRSVYARDNFHNILGKCVVKRMKMEQSYELPSELVELQLKGGSLKFRVAEVECLRGEAWSETPITSSRNGAGQVGQWSAAKRRKQLENGFLPHVRN